MHPMSNLSVDFEKLGISRKVSSTSLYDQAKSLEFSQDSILPSMSRFIDSINNMNHVVMIPSKLYDHECEELDLNDNKSVSSDDASISDCTSISSSLLNLGSSNPDNLSNNSTTLYDSYKMLMQAKEDFLWGFKEDVNVDQNNNETKNSIEDNQIINQFRNNIKQLNNLLINFSEMADYLTNKYQTIYEAN